MQLHAHSSLASSSSSRCVRHPHPHPHKSLNWPMLSSITKTDQIGSSQTRVGALATLTLAAVVLLATLRWVAIVQCAAARTPPSTNTPEWMQHPRLERVEPVPATRRMVTIPAGGLMESMGWVIQLAGTSPFLFLCPSLSVNHYPSPLPFLFSSQLMTFDCWRFFRTRTRKPQTSFGHLREQWGYSGKGWGGQQGPVAVSAAHLKHQPRSL